MLKTLKLGLIAFICLGSFVANAQKKVTEGYVSYNAEYDLPADQQMAAAMLPKEYKLYFKGDVSKFTMDLGMMTNVITSNNKTSEGLMLMDIPAASQKIAVKITPEDKEKQKDMMPDYEIVKTTETKTISGYSATKYTAKDKKSDSTVEIWATNDIDLPLNNFTEGFTGLKGTPLEFVSNMNGLKVKMSFKELKEEAVTGLTMTVPAGYTEMTMDELMSMSGK